MCSGNVIVYSEIPLSKNLDLIEIRQLISNENQLIGSSMMRVFTESYFRIDHSLD